MEVLIEGEVVSELFVLVEGVVHGAKSTSSAAKERKTAKKRSKSMSLLGGGGLMDAGSSKTLEGSTQHDTSASMRGMSFRGGEGASSLHAKGASFSRMSFKDEGASASRKEGSLRFNDGSARHSNPGDVSMRRSHTGTFQGARVECVNRTRLGSSVKRSSSSSSALGIRCWSTLSVLFGKTACPV